MQTPPIPPDEEDRLAELYRLEILYTQPEATFDRITSALASIFEVPVSTLSLIDREHQFFKAAHGLPPEIIGPRRTLRSLSICGHVVGTNDLLVVEDLALDERFADNPLIQASGLRFYAGVPVRTAAGQPVGSLCIMDTKPRHLTRREIRLLQLLADTVMAEIRLRQSSREVIALSGQLAERDKIIAQAKAPA